MRRSVGENTRAVHLDGTFADGVAALEGVRLRDVAGLAFASGGAAITAILLAFTRPGTHVVAPAPVHARTHALLSEVLTRFGVEIDFAPPERVADAVRPATKLILAETIIHPTMTVTDLPKLAGIAREAGALLVVDSSATSPVVCRPLEYGADLVVHTADRYIAEAAGGVVAGRAEMIDPVRRIRDVTGSILDPGASASMRTGLETLPLRVRRQCANAMVFAGAIARHPAVRRVDYPGLADHPSHEIARRLFDEGPEGTRFGSCVTVTPHGGYEAGVALAGSVFGSGEAGRGTEHGGRGADPGGRGADPGGRAAEHGGRGAEHGGTPARNGSTAAHVATGLDEAALTAAGVDAAAVRFSIGLEDVEDLILNVTKGLDAVGAKGAGQPVGS